MSSTQFDVVTAPVREKSEWWRAVLGEYPTGVTAITSTNPEGEPIGMVVGTFMAVSENPPLIGFLPMTDSRSYLEIRENGTFCASVFGSGQEDLCRRFAARAEDRFDEAYWEPTELGNLRLRSANAWFEARIVSEAPAGDHLFVMAEVTGLGTGDGNAGLPLLFLKGGYGSFTVPSLNFNVPGFSGHLRAAESVRGLVQDLADELDTECLLTVIADDSVLVLAAAHLLRSRPRYGIVGMNFPFAAPLTPVFASWNGPEYEKLWIENSRHLLGRVDRPLFGRLLEAVREHGYAITAGEASDNFDVIANDPDVSRADLLEAWGSVRENVEAVLAGWAQSGELGFAEETTLTSLQFPVFGADGRAQFELVISGLPPHPTPAELHALVTRGKSAAAEITVLVGGLVPADYPA